MLTEVYGDEAKRRWWHWRPSESQWFWLVVMLATGVLIALLQVGYVQEQKELAAKAQDRANLQKMADALDQLRFYVKRFSDDVNAKQNISRLIEEMDELERAANEKARKARARDNCDGQIE